MKYEEIINALLENAKALHKLYNEVNLNIETRICRMNKRKTHKIGNDAPNFSCIEFLLQKEQEYATLLESESYERLLSTFDELVELIPVYGEDFIEQYIEGERYFLPLMRVLRNLSNIIYRKRPILEEEIEETDTITINSNRPQMSTSETILDEIFPELEQQHMAHLINIAFKNKKICRGTSYDEIINALILDLIYLSHNLEKDFLYDGHMNMSYNLFLVENEYPNYFSTIDIGEEAILDDHLGKLKNQLLLLPVKTRTCNTKKAFLRCLYIEMLCEEIGEEQLEDFIVDNRNILDSIFYEEEGQAYFSSNHEILKSISVFAPILKKLENLNNSFIEHEENENEKTKKMKVMKKKKSSITKNQ